MLGPLELLALLAVLGLHGPLALLALLAALGHRGPLGVLGHRGRLVA